MKIYKKQMVIRIDDRLSTSVSHLSEALCCSKSALVRLATQRFVDQMDEDQVELAMRFFQSDIQEVCEAALDSNTAPGSKTS